MPSEAVARDEFETVKQLLVSAASYAESANKQADRNTATIADNAAMIDRLGEKIDQSVAELKQAQDRTQQQLDELGQKQDRTQQQLDSFIFESQRLMLGHADRIQKLEGISERLEGILSYLVRKDDQGE